MLWMIDIHVGSRWPIFISVCDVSVRQRQASTHILHSFPSFSHPFLSGYSRCSSLLTKLSYNRKSQFAIRNTSFIFFFLLHNKKHTNITNMIQRCSLMRLRPKRFIHTSYSVSFSPAGALNNPSSPTPPTHAFLFTSGMGASPRNKEATKSKLANYTHRSMTSSSFNINTTKDTMASYLNNLSPRQEVKLEEDILAAISHEENGVIDPILKNNIRSLGWIQSIEFQKNTGIGIGIGVGTADERGPGVNINLRLPTLMHPNMQEMKEKIQSIVAAQIRSAIKQKNMAIPGKDTALANADSLIHVIIAASKPAPFVRNIDEQNALIQKLGPGLANVRHFLAVYSCKGGVGKSTVAVNLAYELSRLGGRVGLLDVDVYGPSLPVLVNPDDPEVRQSTIGPGVVKPIVHKGVKMLSLGFVSPTVSILNRLLLTCGSFSNCAVFPFIYQSGVPGSGKAGGAAVMRGPMAGKVVTQL